MGRGHRTDTSDHMFELDLKHVFLQTVAAAIRAALSQSMVRFVLRPHPQSFTHTHAHKHHRTHNHTIRTQPPLKLCPGGPRRKE